MARGGPCTEGKKAVVDSAAYQAKLRALMTARYPNWKAEGSDDVEETEVEIEEIISVTEEPLLQ